mgnify:FL=1
MDTIFLVLSLFLPRLALVVYWFLGMIPFNTVPFFGDVLLTIFLPRVLVIIFIVQNLGTESPWFWIHLIVGIGVYIFGGNKARKRKKKD